MKTSFLNQKRLPLVVELEGGRSAVAPEEFFGACLGEAEQLRRRLLECGALLLRGCPVPTAAQFARFVRAFSGRDLLDYVAGASPRVKLGDGVYTSTEYPRDYTLSLHNELSYTHRWPDHLYFCCATPAERGGETPVADSRAVLKGIDPAVVREFKRRGIKYVRNLHGGAGSGYSWQEAFETDDRRAVERYCLAGGVDFEWKEDGGLTLCEVRPATARHPLTGEEVWFNQAEGFHPSVFGPEGRAAPGSRAEEKESRPNSDGAKKFHANPDSESDSEEASRPNSGEELRSNFDREEEFRLNSYYGDGAPLGRAALDHIREVTRAESVPVYWRAGDILILDNLLAAHGRMPFAGRRKVLLAMT